MTLRTGQGEINANTGSGDVSIELATATLESVNANTGSGDVAIEVSSIKDELNANTGSGDVEIRVAEATSPGKASLNSGSGDMLLVVPGNILGSFELKTMSGDITLPPSLGIPVKKDVSGQRVAKGSAGNGGGKYRMNSGSGDIEVRFGNALPAKDE